MTTVTLRRLDYMRSLLRGRIKEPEEDKFTNIELNLELSLAQFDVIKRLLKINKAWFAKIVSIKLKRTTTYGMGAIPSDCSQIEAITDPTGRQITELPLSKVGLLTNLMYAPSLSDARYLHIGNDIYVYSGISSIPTIWLYHIQKPNELVNDTDITILPVEFVDMIIACALWKCAAKAGLSEAQKEKEYDDMFVELELRYRRDIETATSGQERK